MPYDIQAIRAHRIGTYLHLAAIELSDVESPEIFKRSVRVSVELTQSDQPRSHAHVPEQWFRLGAVPHLQGAVLHIPAALLGVADISLASGQQLGWVRWKLP